MEEIRKKDDESKAQLTRMITDWNKNFPGKKKVLDSLRKLANIQIIEYKLVDFLKWLEEDEERKLGKKNWDEAVEKTLQPPSTPPLYFQKYAEAIKLFPNADAIINRTDGALWNWIQTLNNSHEH